MGPAPAGTIAILPLIFDSRICQNLEPLERLDWLTKNIFCLDCPSVACSARSPVC